MFYVFILVMQQMEVLNICLNDGIISLGKRLEDDVKSTGGLIEQVEISFQNLKS